MASDFKLATGFVHVRLYDVVDGLDVMSVHGDETFLEQTRLYKKVVYDYSDATEIRLSLEDAKAFARLAALESSITKGLVIAVISKDASHLEGSKVYQREANRAGGNVVLVEKPEDVLEV